MTSFQISPASWLYAHQLEVVRGRTFTVHALCSCGAFQGPERRGNAKAKQAKSDHFQHLCEVARERRQLYGSSTFPRTEVTP